MSAIGYRLGSAWRPAVALALAIGLMAPSMSGFGTAAQSGLPRTAAAAPESTVLYHEFDLDLEGEQWQQTEALLARVGVPEALDLWREEILNEEEYSGDFTEADLDALLGGEMAVIVTSDAVERLVAMHMSKLSGHEGGAESATPQADTADEAFGVAAVLLPGDADAAWAYAQRQVNTLAEQEDLQVEEGTHGDAELIWVEGLGGEFDADAMGADPFEEMFGHHGRAGFAAGRAGDYIIAGKTPADVTSIVNVIDGSAPSLADSVLAQDIVSQLPADALSLTYIDAQAMFEAFGPELMESLQSFMPESMPQEAWGGAVGLAISAADVGFRLDSFSRFPEGTDLESLLIVNDPAVMASAERAPDGTFLFEAGAVPPHTFAGLAFTVAQAVNAASGESEWAEDQEMMALPTPEEIEEEIAKATATLGFNPAADLFDLLGSEFIAFASFPSFSMDGFGLDAVAAISTTNPAALAETSRKIAAWIERAAPEADVSVRREGEDTLFVVSDPETDEAPAVEFGVVGDQAVFAMGSGVRDLLNEPSSSLADDEQYQTVMGELPADFYQIAYVDIGQAIAPIMMLTGEFGSSPITDADLACTEFADQALAQAAYDADPVAKSDLDLDFDGEACEDAFAVAGATPGAVPGSLENIRALGMVAFEHEEGAGSSAILYIAEPGS